MPPLRALVGAGHDVAIVVSPPDRRRGRGGVAGPSPVKAAALELGLAVTERVDDVLGVGCELGVVVAFGRLIRPHVLAGLDFVNVHFSLLPRWRGAAPVERAILAGDRETGVCVMGLEAELDTGPVFRRARVAIGPEDTAEELRARLVALGTGLLVSALAEGLGQPEPQVGEPTYAAKIEPAERVLDWTCPAVEAHRVVRIGDAWTTFRARRLKVLRARLAADRPGRPGPPGTLDGVLVACDDGGAVELVEVQPEGRPAVSAEAWRRGARPLPAERLGA